MLGLPENGPPTVGMHTLPLSRDRYRRLFAEGVTLAVLGRQPFEGTMVPAGVKHRSRLHWWLAEQAVRDPANPCHCPGAVPVLVGADGGADTAIGTPLAVVGGTVVRPPRGTVLDGVSVMVVEELCGRLGLPFAEDGLNYGALPADVSEVVLTGSAFGVAGVKAVVSAGGRRELPWPGPVLGKLLAGWNEMAGMDVAKQFVG
jgi:branched-chain amino acid aminotransferase